jgi:hypothetical protein
MLIFSPHTDSVQIPVSDNATLFNPGVSSETYVAEATSVANAIQKGDIKSVEKHVKTMGTETFIGFSAENTIMTPLSLAVYFNQADIIKFLILMKAKGNPAMHLMKFELGTIKIFQKYFKLDMSTLQHMFIETSEGVCTFKPYCALYWALLKPNRCPDFVIAYILILYMAGSWKSKIFCRPWPQITIYWNGYSITACKLTFISGDMGVVLRTLLMKLCVGAMSSALSWCFAPGKALFATFTGMRLIPGSLQYLCCGGLSISVLWSMTSPRPT